MVDVIESFNKKILSRYMSYKFLMDVLENNRLTLLNPDNWEDKNDTVAMTHYKKARKLSSLLAICFTQTSETYHHWQVYGKDEAVRIIFNRDLLIDSIPNNNEYISGEVDYVLLNKFESRVTDIKQIPFVKRYPYRDEDEYRIIWQSNNENKDKQYLPIPDLCIKQISIGPGLSPDRFITVKREIKSKCKYDINVYRTTVTENNRWKKMVQNLT